MVGCTYEMNRPVKKYPEVQSAKENLETKGVLVNKLIIPDLSRMVMEIVKDSEHNKARQYRIENTKQFRKQFGWLWSDVMDSVKKDKYPYTFINNRIHNQIRAFNAFDFAVLFDHYFIRIELKSVNTRTDYFKTKEDNKRTRWCSPHNIKRSNKVRDSYIKRDTKRRMKMITKR